MKSLIVLILLVSAQAHAKSDLCSDKLQRKYDKAVEQALFKATVAEGDWQKQNDIEDQVTFDFEMKHDCLIKADF